MSLKNITRRNFIQNIVKYCGAGSLLNLFEEVLFEKVLDKRIQII
jgi:hypothetical protein